MTFPSKFLDRCRFKSQNATGTSDFVSTSALQGYQLPSAAGITNGAQYSYAAETDDQTRWELGYGTYNTGTGVLVRNVLFSSTGAKVDFGNGTGPKVSIGILLKEDLDAVTSVVPTGSPGPTRQVIDLFSDDYSHWKSEGVVGDLVTDDGPALNTYMNRVSATGGGVIRLSGSYLCNTPLAIPANVILDGGGSAVIKLTGTNYRVFTMTSVSRAGFRGFQVDVSGSSALSGFAGYCSDITDCEIRDNLFTSIKGEVYVTGTCSGNKLTGNKIVNSGSRGIHLDGANVAGNFVTFNDFTSCTSFGIFLDNGAHHNTIAFNKTLVNGVELIGIRYDCHYNRVIGNHAEGTGDNGISITGKYNTVVGNVCRHNYYSGIGVYGDYNTVNGNVCVGNGQSYLVNPANLHSGIVIQCAFGGLAQNNTVVGNTTDDDQVSMTQNWGINLSGVNSLYTTWATGLVFGALSYCKNGTNIYVSNAGGTSGSTAPTHTSGTVSDGGVSWLYIDTWPNGREPVGNVIGPNACYRSRTGVALSDSTVNNNNTVIDDTYVRVHNTSASTNEKYDVTGIIRHLQPWVNGQAVTYGNMRYSSGGHAYRVSNVGGTCANEPSHTSGTVAGADGIAWLLVQQSTRDQLVAQTPNGPAVNIDAALGIGRADAIATFLNIIAGSGDPNGVVTSPKGSVFLRADGGPGSSVYIHEGTGTSNYFPIFGTFAKSFVASALTATTNETALATIAIPASLFGIDGGLKITAFWSGTSSANNKTIRARFGASGLGGSQILSQVFTTGNVLKSETVLGNRHSASSQYVLNQVPRGTDGLVTTSTATSSVDTTAAQNVVLTGQLANGSETLTLEGYIIEVIKP